MRILNRIAPLTDEGLIYEPDPRHAGLMARNLALEGEIGELMFAICVKQVLMTIVLCQLVFANHVVVDVSVRYVLRLTPSSAP